MFRKIINAIRRLWEKIRAAEVLDDIDVSVRKKRRAATPPDSKPEKTSIPAPPIKKSPDAGGKSPVRLRRVFDGGEKPRKELHSMQFMAASAIFAQIGGEYLPGRLIDLLKEHDAIYAVRLFLSHMEMNYGDIVADADKQKLFRQAMDVLWDMEITARDSRLLDEPFYEAIRNEDIDEARRLAKRLIYVADILRAISSGSAIVFFEYKAAFLPKVEKCKDKWESLSDGDIENLRAEARMFMDCQRHYDARCSDIEEILREANHKISELEKLRGADAVEDYRRIWAGLADKAERAKEEAVNGARPLSACMDAIEEIYRDLCKLWGELEKIAPPPDTPRDEIQDAFETLGLSPDIGGDCAKIKGAYRIQSKRNHPDKFPDADEKAAAEEKMKDINGAYNILRDKFKCP